MENRRLKVSDKKTKNSPNITFSFNDNFLVRTTEIGSLKGTQNLPYNNSLDDTCSQQELASIWGAEALKLKRKILTGREVKRHLNVADFFCGSGGLSLGVENALNSVGIGANFLVACDKSKDSLDVYNANFSPDKLILDNAANLVQQGKSIQFQGFSIPEIQDLKLSPEINDFIGQVDVFAAGPPCEGNSNLNNLTRRTDHKNNHYVIAALLGAKLGASIILIENVQTVKSAKQNVVDQAKIILANAGYSVKNCEYVLKAENFNVAQKRVRHFLIAAKDVSGEEMVDYNNLIMQPLSAMDVIGDLVDNKKSDTMNLSSDLSEENKKRINYLFDNNLYDLPDTERPYCHREKEHTYPSVYGRMSPDQPAFTLTTGFLSPGRGRYIHPVERRGLTPREGARLQSFPDYFKWQTPLCRVSRNSITRLIGDAVPPNLGEAAMLIGLALCKNFH